MGKRIINDDELMALYEQHLPQKEIALRLGVSPVSICKKLQKLLPQPETILDGIQEKYDLTDKELSFCLEKSKGGVSHMNAVLKSRYEATSPQSAKALGGGELMARPEIKQTIEELLNYHGLTKSYRIGKLKEHVNNRDGNLSLKALSESWKLDGSYAQDKASQRVQVVASNFIVVLKPEDVEKFIGNDEN